MSLTRKVAHNTMVQLAAKAVSVALGLVIVGTLTRHLGKEGFGNYTTVNAFLQVFAVLVDLGLYLVLIQMVSRPRVDEEKIVSNIFTVKFFSSLAFLILAPAVAFLVPSYSHIIKLGVAVMAAKFLFGSLIQVMTGLFQQKLKMNKVAVGEVIGRTFLAVSVFVAAKLDWGILSIFALISVSGLVNFLIVFFSARKMVRIRFRFDLDVWKDIFRQCWPIAVSVAFTLLYFKGDTVILSLSRSQSEVGIYGAAYRIIEVLVMLPPMFTGLVLPQLARSWSEGDKGRFGRILQKSFDFFAIFIVPVIIGTFALADRIIAAIAGPGFEEAAGVLRVLIFATGMIFLGNIFCRTVVAIGKQKILMRFYGLTAFIALFGYAIFIPRYSYYGAAAMTVVAESVIAISAFAVVLKFAKARPSFLPLSKALVSGLAMAAAIFLLRGWRLLAIVPLAALAYFAVLFATGGINKGLVMEIIKINKGKQK